MGLINNVTSWHIFACAVIMLLASGQRLWEEARSVTRSTHDLQICDVCISMVDIPNRHSLHKAFNNTTDCRIATLMDTLIPAMTLYIR